MRLSSTIPQEVPLCDHLVWLRGAIEPKEIIAHLANIDGGWTEFATICVTIDEVVLHLPYHSLSGRNLRTYGCTFYRGGKL